jgi:hypothetical protein
MNPPEILFTKEQSAELRAKIAAAYREQAMQKLAGAAYDEERIPEVRAIRDDEDKALDDTKAKIADLKEKQANENDHTRETRQKLKALEKEEERLALRILELDELVEKMKTGARNARGTAAELLARANHIETFDPEAYLAKKEAEHKSESAPAKPEEEHGQEHHAPTA